MPLPPVKSNVPNLVHVQPPVGGAQGPVNNAPVGNPPAAPELQGEDPQAQAPRMPTGELVAKLDSLLARAAKTATASVDAAALEAAAGAANLDELTRQELFTRLVNEYPAELRDEIRQKIAADPGITKLSADRLEIDPTKFETGELHWIFRRCTGSDCDVLPQFIDEDLYNRLVAMGPDSEARKAYKRNLLKRLPADAVAGAMLRLDDAIALAKRYKDEGKVVSAEDFEKREVQNHILDNELKRPTNPIKPMDNGFDFKKSETVLAKEINQECRFQIHGLFIGDLFRHVYRTGWYK